MATVPVYPVLESVRDQMEVPVAEADRPKTAFCTPFGFERNGMPFGVCNVPSTFQRLMQQIFGDQQCQSLLLYLEDIVVFSATAEQHLGRLQISLGRLNQGVSTDPDKVEVVANCQLPLTASKLRSFLGFASDYRQFVEGFARMTGPLHRLVAPVEGTKLQKAS